MAMKTRLTQHARKRMTERFKLSQDDQSAIGGRLGDPKCYEVVGRAPRSGEIRRIQYGDLSLSAIVDKGWVVTVYHGDSDSHEKNTMTLDELAEDLRVTVKAVCEAADYLFPGRRRSANTIHLTIAEVFEITKEIEKRMSTAVPCRRIMKFDYHGSGIREIAGKDGAPWFVASDVCAVLGLTVGSAMQNVDDDEKSKIPNKYLGSPGGHDSPVVSESGLYALILRSRKEEAKKFRKWVTGVVLPAIRRTGRYAPSREIPDFSDPAAAARAWADQYERRQIAEDKLEVAGPKAEFYDRVTSADNCVDVTAAAHILNLPGVGRNNLFKRLREEKMLRSDNEPYQIHVAAGRFRVIETETAAGVKRKTLITQKGLDYIRRVLG